MGHFDAVYDYATVEEQLAYLQGVRDVFDALHEWTLELTVTTIEHRHSVNLAIEELLQKLADGEPADEEEDESEGH